MKQKFEITISRSHFRTYNIEANTKEEALEILEARIENPCEESYSDEEILFDEFV